MNAKKDEHFEWKGFDRRIIIGSCGQRTGTISFIAVNLFLDHGDDCGRRDIKRFGKLKDCNQGRLLVTAFKVRNESPIKVT